MFYFKWGIREVVNEHTTRIGYQHTEEVIFGVGVAAAVKYMKFIMENLYPRNEHIHPYGCCERQCREYMYLYFCANLKCQFPF